MSSYPGWPRASRIAVILLIVLLAVVLCAVFLTLPGPLSPRQTKIADLLANPIAYDGKKIKAQGYLVRNTGAFLGDRYALYAYDPMNQYFAENPSVAVGGSSETLDPYVSFVYDGTRFEIREGARPVEVAIEGTFRSRGPVTDASPYYIEVSRVYPLGQTS